MEEKIDQQGGTEQDLRILTDTKIELDEKLDQKMKGVIFRTKAKWLDLSEKSSKYFYSLEKANYQSKTCVKLLNEDGSYTNDEWEILRRQGQFYEMLYTSDKTVKFDVINSEGIRICERTRQATEEEITYEEFSDALKQMKNGKCPGLDGIPCDFYKFFYKKLGRTMYETCMFVLKRGTLHDTALRGIINLIPKAGKDVRVLANLRPITLLCADYKVMGKVLANRLKPALEEVINEQQKGFLKDRRISSNIRKILDLMHKMEADSTEAAILSLDFKKCFDMIEFDCIFKSLDFFGFGPNMISWAKTLYKDFKACVQNNGFFSNNFAVSCSVHQGGCCSTYFFLLCAEVLAIELRKNPKIKRFIIQQIEYLLSQYADDMDVLLVNDKDSIKEVFKVLKWFRSKSGFTVNYDKTVIYRIGSMKNSRADQYTKVDGKSKVKWTSEPINVLGVWIAHDKDKLLELNYEGIVDKVKNILNRWENHGISLIGKVNVINTLCASLFIYKMSVLLNMPPKIRNQVEDLFVKYIWNNGVAKISKEILQGNKDDGGLGLVNLQVKEKALKIAWVQTLKKDVELSNLVYSCITPELKEKIWECNLSTKDVEYTVQHGILGQNTFWNDVLLAWSEYNFEKLVEHSGNQIIWLNSHIRVNERPILWTKPLIRGLMYTHQLCKDGQFKSARQMYTEFGLTVMEYNSIVSALPKAWKKDKSILICKRSITNYERAIEMVSTTSKVYKKLNENTVLLARKVCNWERELGVVIEYKDFIHVTQDIYKVTNIVKYRSFQYWLLQRSLTTNIQLCRYQIKNTDLCSFCNKEKRSVLHLFIYCDTVKPFWIKVEKLMYEFDETPIHFGVDTVLCNRVIDEAGHIKNFICLLAKQYI